MKIPRLLLTIPLSFAFCQSLIAEDTDRGRLPDGRAFRTDAEGNQLVDYIAELELNVESLKRRVVGLEDEVSSKQIMIERLNKGETLEGNLEQRDLLADSDQSETERVPAAELIQLKSQLNRQIENQASENRELRARVIALQNQLNADSNAPLGVSAAGTLSLQDLRKQLQTAESDLEIEKQVSAQELGRLRTELAQAQEQIARLQVQNQEVSAKLEKNNKHFEQLLEQRERAAKLENVRPVISRPETGADLDRQNRASYSPARSKAVESIQGAVVTELNKLSGLVATRDRLLREYESQARSVKIRPASTVSSRGMTMAQLRTETQRANSVYALNYLRQDINQIKARVQDDITVIQRMLK